MEYNYLEEAWRKMTSVSLGKSEATDMEIVTMLLAGIGQQLARIATYLEDNG